MEHYSILTTAGAAFFAQAVIDGTAIVGADFQLAVGDGGGEQYEPTPDQTELRGEQWRGVINNIYHNPDNDSQIAIEGIVPAAVGGWVIREWGIFSKSGVLIAVGGVSDVFKPLPPSTEVKQVVIQSILDIKNAAVLKLIIDDNIITASKAYVDELFKKLPMVFTPEQFGAVGDGITDDTTPVSRAIMAGWCIMRRGATYRMVMTENNVITPPAGAIIDFNGADVTHETMGFLLFLIKNPDVTLINFSGIYKGTYPTSAIPTTRYGISRPHEAAFTGFIGLYGNAYRLKVTRAKVVGASSINKYDFLVNGFEGDFRGSIIDSVYATHYSCLFCNNLARIKINDVNATLRHADSIAVYGPSHLIYANMTSGTISRVREFGSLLSNMSYGAEATIQITAGSNCLIDDVTTTMDNVGVVAYKGEGDGATYRKIVSRSNFTITKSSRLFEIQTNLQSTILNTTLDDIKLFLPTGNIQASAFWSGGSRTKARNVFIDVPYTDAIRESEVAYLVTSTNADIELDVRASRNDSLILLSAFNASKLKVNVLGNPITYKSNYSIFGGGWGECTGSTIETVDKLNSINPSVLSVNHDTRLNCFFEFGGAVSGESYGQVINQSSTTTIINSIRISAPPINPGLSFHNILTYEVDVNCHSLNAGQALYVKYVLFVSSNGSIIKGTIKTITSQQMGEVNIASDIAFNPDSGYLTVICTRQPGGENLRSLIVRARLINTRPYF